ncbi:MAG: MoaD/ThiS family protein [Candidatus Heimdallarchaeum aukensis]|uniref:MoaD/ThiS family protein n=1 Tax=Candidatus Heimdallarchaeum aukensis TaxID=2876573 RepID=A0A9Y1BK72_9ARCH|nr:MAG: MoaD/ThiS family protein [Candidatus Heimdallarchaeum aukensis]
MKIYVKVFAYLRQKYPHVNDLNPLELDVDENATVEDVIKKLDFKPEEIHLILLNGKKVSKSELLEDNCTISLFPPIGGG